MAPLARTIISYEIGYAVDAVCVCVNPASMQNKQSFLVAGDAAYPEDAGESITIISDSSPSSSSSSASSSSAVDELAVRTGDLVAIAYKGRLTAEHGDRQFDAARSFAFQVKTRGRRFHNENTGRRA